MSTIKRKVFRVLKWAAILAGLVGLLVSVLIGVNAFRVHFYTSTYYIPPSGGNPNPTRGVPVLFTYEGYVYDFNVIMSVNLLFPNGTVIASDTAAAVWPLGLYPNTFQWLDISLTYPQSAIDWSKANNQPLIVFTVAFAWFNLPVGGQNIIITPVTLYNIYPVFPQ
nr:hypothetical protein [Candidatus Freyarchaeota archaeon]